LAKTEIQSCVCLLSAKNSSTYVSEQEQSSAFPKIPNKLGSAKNDQTGVSVDKIFCKRKEGFLLCVHAPKNIWPLQQFMNKMTEPSFL